MFTYTSLYFPVYKKMKYGLCPKFKGDKMSGASSFLICVTDNFLQCVEQCVTNLESETLLLCLQTQGTFFLRNKFA